MPGNRKQVSFVDRCISAFKNRNNVENPIEMSEYLLYFFQTKMQPNLKNLVAFFFPTILI